MNTKIRALKYLAMSLSMLMVLGMAYLIVMTIGDINAMGPISPELSFHLDREEYIIKSKNNIEIQTDNSCSGHSSAYVLRHWGIEAQGDSVYNSIPVKGDKGYVAPKEVVGVLNKNGMSATYKCGNLTVLKNEVSKGYPTIVLIRVDMEHDWLHYVPVVGYTPDSIYIAESIDYLANRQYINYNRAISMDEFCKLWNTSSWKMPLYRNTFISVIPKDF